MHQTLWCFSSHNNDCTRAPLVISNNYVCIHLYFIKESFKCKNTRLDEDWCLYKTFESWECYTRNTTNSQWNWLSWISSPTESHACQKTRISIWMWICLLQLITSNWPGIPTWELRAHLRMSCLYLRLIMKVCKLFLIFIPNVSDVKSINIKLLS